MIREEGYISVNKTRFIRVLEGFSEPYVFFLGPRRFGKNLFVSLISSYYAMFELKYLKSGDSEDMIREICMKGIDQLKRYSASPEFSHGENI